MSKQNSHEVTSKKQTNKPLFTPGLTRFCIVMVIIIIAAIVIPNSITQIHEKLFPEPATTEIVKQKLENMGSWLRKLHIPKESPLARMTEK